MGRCVGARACGQDIPGPRRRGLRVMHFGVQAAMGPMCFAWMVTFVTCASTLPARSDVVPHIRSEWPLKAVGGWVE